MDPTDIHPHLKALRSAISQLTTALKPITSPSNPDEKSNSPSTLTDLTAKLPLLDKAKLHVLLAYAINTLIFCTLKLNGVDTDNHPVKTVELARCKQYFEKIQAAENVNAGPRQRVDREAVGRFVRHGVGGKGDASAAKKIRFDEDGKAVMAEGSKKRKKGNGGGNVEQAMDGASSKRRKSSPDGDKEELSAQSEGEDRPDRDDGQDNSPTTRRQDDIAEIDRAEDAPEGDPTLTKSQRKRRRAREKKGYQPVEFSRGKKSNKPPRDSKQVLQDLLGKGAHQKREKIDETS